MMPRATRKRGHSAAPLGVSSRLSPPSKGTCIRVINDHRLRRIPIEILIPKSPRKEENLGTCTHKRKFNVFFQGYYSMAKYTGDHYWNQAG